MATSVELTNRALRKLGVLESGQSPTTDEATDAAAVYTSIYGYLAHRNAVTWDSGDSIPTPAELAVTTILQAELADEFGSPEGEYQRLQFEAYGPAGKHGQAGGALADLIFLAKPRYTPQVTEAEYF